MASQTVKKLLAGGLPALLDLGPNAPDGGNPTQYAERTPPTNTANQGAITPQPVNWPLWIGVGLAGLVAVGVLLKAR